MCCNGPTASRLGFESHRLEHVSRQLDNALNNVSSMFRPLVDDEVLAQSGLWAAVEGGGISYDIDTEE